MPGTAKAQSPQSAKPPFSFDELVQLSTESPSPALMARLNRVLTTPVVRNGAAAQPGSRASSHPVRITEWNIARGVGLDAIEQVISSPDAFVQPAPDEKKLSSSREQKLRSQMEMLRDSDVLILNEVDIGVKRTDYRNVVEELAATLHMNYAYAVEFLEVDPVVDLGSEPAVLNTAAESERMSADLKPDPKRYQGLHVNAILSRTPIRNARVVPLPVCHDWYGDETHEVSQLETAKRKVANTVFLERIGREVRRGARSALVAEVATPGGPAQSLTVVNAHLENKCKPACRNTQMKALLNTLDKVDGPLVLGGDLNSTGTNGTPTSWSYELETRVKDYQFWISTLVGFTPAGIAGTAASPLNFWRNFRDPTGVNILIFGRNPEAALFRSVKDFEFADGTSFDFQGRKSLNRQQSGKTLSDSNERATKGFTTTFAMKRNFKGLLKYRLDWLFVKPGATGSSSITRPLMPAWPTTLQELNEHSPEISDHTAITLQLVQGSGR